MTNSPESWMKHPVAFADTFHLRRPVLEAVESLRGKWKLSEDGKSLAVQHDLGGLSSGERAIVEFALNPYNTEKNIFHIIGATPELPGILASALYELFKDGGPARSERAVAR